MMITHFCFRLFTSGVDFDALNLFPPVPFPVSPGTPMLSPLVKWDHSQSWPVPQHTDFSISGSGGKNSHVFKIDASLESEDHYLIDHVIDGRVLFPATGSLVLVWKMLAKLKGQSYEKMPVAFQDVILHRAIILPTKGLRAVIFIKV